MAPSASGVWAIVAGANNKKQTTRTAINFRTTLFLSYSLEVDRIDPQWRDTSRARPIASFYWIAHAYQCDS